MSTELAKIDASQIDLTDMLDDERAIAGIKESVLEDFVYRVQGGLKLSKKGVDWASREYAKNKEILEIVDHPKVEPDRSDPEYVLVTVLAQRSVIADGKKVPLDSTVGAKREWRKMKLRSDYEGNLGKPGEVVDDPFWFEKAVGKAQRNAKLGLMEQDFVAKIIGAWIEKKRGKSPPKSGGEKKPPEETPVERAKRAAQQPAPTGATPPASDNSERAKKIRQDFFGILAAIGFKSHDEQKKAFWGLVPACRGKSSTEVSEGILLKVTGILRGTLRDGPNELKMSAEGGWVVSEKSTGKVLLPEAVPTVPSQPESPVGEEPF